MARESAMVRAVKVRIEQNEANLKPIIEKNVDLESMLDAGREHARGIQALIDSDRELLAMEAELRKGERDATETEGAADGQ